MNARFVIFDLDGTLIESEQIWRDVRRNFVLEHGGRWRDGAQDAMIGMRTAEWSRYMHEDLGVALAPQAIADAVVDSVIRCLSQHVPVLPGAEEALARLSSAYCLGLATSATAAVAQAALKETGWSSYFEAVVSADSVARGKPAPDVYLRALEMLSAQPSETVAVEDSSNGIRSAHAAGLAVIAIPNREFRPGADALSLAACVLDSLQSLDSDVVEALGI